MVFDWIKEWDNKWRLPEKFMRIGFFAFVVEMILYALAYVLFVADQSNNSLCSEALDFFRFLLAGQFGMLLGLSLSSSIFKGMEVRGVRLYHNTAIERIEQALQYHAVSFTKQSIHGPIPRVFLFRVKEIFEIPCSNIKIKVLKGMMKLSRIYIGPVTDGNTDEIAKLKAIIDDGLKFEHQVKERPTDYVPPNYKGNQN